MSGQSYKDLLRISIPATLESLFVVLVTMLDTQMVSPLGTTAISAVSVATQPKLLLFLVFTALGTSTTIVVAQAFGREDKRGANAVLVHALKIAAVGSVILGAVAAACAWPIMIVCSNQQDTMDMSVIFLRILMVGMVFQALSTAMNAALRGIGDMKATLISNVVMGVVDIIFNYLLIEGHLGFPAWGVAGAAAATALGNVAGFLVSLLFILRKDCFLSLPYCLANKVRIGKDDSSELRKKLINVFGENILTRLGFLVSGIIVARLGSYETSVYSVGAQLLGLSFAFGDGIQAAVLSLVGKCVGAGDKEKCADYVHTGVRLGIFVSIFIAIGCIAFGGPFYSLFNSDPEFCAAGGVVALFGAAAAPFQVVRIVRVAALRGFGDTKRPRQIATISVLIVDPPFSFLFAIALGMGQWGLWIGTLISQITWFALAELTSRKAMREYLDA